MNSWRVLKIFKVIIFAILAILAVGAVVMGLWNDLVPELFNGPRLTFLQAIGLLLLAQFLVRGGFWRGPRWIGGGWHRKFEEKLAAMTPEEREQFKAEYRRRCGHWSHDEQTGTQETTGGQKA